MNFYSFVTFLLFFIRNSNVFVDKFHQYLTPQLVMTSDPDKTTMHSSTQDIYIPFSQNTHKIPQQLQNIYIDLTRVTLIYQIRRRVRMKVDGLWR